MIRREGEGNCILIRNIDLLLYCTEVLSILFWDKVHISAEDYF